LITSLSPGGGEKMPKHSVPAGDIGALLAQFLVIRQKTLFLCLFSHAVAADARA
jgi:hypothetical protein